MTRPKKLEVEMRALASTFQDLSTKGYNRMRVDLPEPDPAIAWNLQKAGVKAWRSAKTRPATGTGPGWKGEPLEDKK